MDATTRWRSSKDAVFLDEHDERLEDADAVGDADADDGTTEEVVGDAVDVVWSVKIGFEGVVGVSTIFDIDGTVVRCVF